MNFLDEWVNRTDGHANKPENQGNPARGIFVIGTDTDVGKTYASCLLIRQLAQRGLCVGVYKPVASGLVPGQPTDAERLIAASGRAWPLERACPQSFTAPLAPPLAAAREGRHVDPHLLAAGVQWWRDRCDVLLVEGAGGALSPLSMQTTVLDLASRLEYPLVLVAGHRLGMINHTLLTLEAAAHRGLKTLALIVNSLSPPDDCDADCVQLAESLQSIKAFCSNVPCWTLAHGATTLSQAAT
jgi:dethiobiotin synthetase